MSAPPDYPALYWLDLETTGLDLDEALVLEVAVVVTTPDLDRVLDTLHAVVGWPRHDVERAMAYEDDPEAVHAMHTRNGLLADVARVHNADDRVHSYEHRVLDAMRDIAEAHPGALLAGSGVARFDRPLLALQAPTVLAPLHYRELDVSTLRTYVQLYHPDVPRYHKSDGHRAVSDVHDAIAELRHYRRHLGPDSKEQT